MSKAEVEINWLRNEILPKIAQAGKFSETCGMHSEMQQHDFNVLDIAIKFIGEDEAFMLTTCYRVLLTYTISNVQQTRKLVVKKTPSIPREVYDIVCYEALFRNEIEFYTKILPAIRTFLNEDQDQDEDEGYVAPSYYYGEVKPGFAAIILGDFNESGWQMTKAQYNLTLEHVLLAAQYIGRFHGIGYAMKQTNYAKFKELVAPLAESRFASDSRIHEYELELQTSFRRMLMAARKYHAEEIEESFLKALADLNAYSIAYGRRCVAPVEPLCTLCHGDYLRNNVAYRYDAAGRSPNAIMMFDYQTMRLASPMIDFSLFLSMSTLAGTRSKHFAQIFNCYHGALSETFERRTGTSLPTYLSRDALLVEYIRFLPFSAAITSFFLMTIVEPKRLTADELLKRELTDAQIIQDTLARGGELIDRELAHQVLEMYQLSLEYKVNLSEAFIQQGN